MNNYSKKNTLNENDSYIIKRDLSKNVKIYNFDDLSNLSSNQSKIKNSDSNEFHISQNFNFPSIQKDSVSKEIIDIENNYSKENNFELDPFVFEFRGQAERLKEKEEKKINNLVEQKLKKLQGDIYKKSYEEGFNKGREDAYKENLSQIEKFKRDLEMFSESVFNQYDNIYIYQREEMIELLKSIVNWAIQKELNNDGEYLGRILKRMILEFKDSSKMLIKVHNKQLQKVMTTLGEFKDHSVLFEKIRIEVDPTLDRDLEVKLESPIGGGHFSFNKLNQEIEQIFQAASIGEKIIHNDEIGSVESQNKELMDKDNPNDN
jgi:flagellar assembly protein FliH